MKKQIPFSIVIFNSILSKAKPSIQWQKSLGGTNDDGANSIQQTFDGRYIAARYSCSSIGDVTCNHGSSDYCNRKLGGTNAGISEYINKNLLNIYSNPSNGTFTIKSAMRSCLFYSKSFKKKLTNENNYIININILI